MRTAVGLSASTPNPFEDFVATLHGRQKLPFLVPHNQDRIRVAIGRSPPDAFDSCRNFPTFEPYVDCPFPGFTLEIVSMLAAAGRFYLEPVILNAPVGTVNWGQYVGNSTFSGVLAMLQTYKIDTVCLLFQYVDEREEFFDYSEVVTFIRTVYIAKKRKKNIGLALWNAFKPYQLNIWLLLLAFMIAQCLIAALVSKLEVRLKLTAIFAPMEKFFQYLRLHVHQPMDHSVPFIMKSGNFSFLFYSIMQATLFTNLYSTILLSALIKGEDTRPWDSFDTMIGLVAAKEYTFVVDRFHYEGSWFFKEVIRSNTSHIRKIYHALERNPVHITETVEEAFQYVDQGGYIFATQEDSYAMHFSTERCNYFYDTDHEISKPAHFLFSEANPMLNRWNEAIRGNRAFIQRTYRKYFRYNYRTGDIPECEASESDIPESRKPLNMTATFGIFLILVIGWFVASMAFVIEWLLTIIRDKYDRLPMHADRLLAEPWQVLDRTRRFRIKEPESDVYVIPQKKQSVAKWFSRAMKEHLN